MTQNARTLRNKIFGAGLCAQLLLIGCANPKNSPAPVRMTLQQQDLSRTVFTQEQRINVLRARLDSLAPGESRKFGPYPGDSDLPEPPAAGPDMAQNSIPGAGPRESVAELKERNEKQAALIKALKARLKELENKKS